jgi:flagellar basal-body rod modification protein FlgD
MATAVSSLSSLAASNTGAPQTNNASTSSSSTTGTSAPAPTEQVFLQLLVAQMKNQDPTSPSDPTAFVSELAQFSELEQVIAIRGDIEKAPGTTQANAGGSNPTGGTNTNPTTTNTNQSSNAAQS